MHVIPDVPSGMKPVFTERMLRLGLGSLNNLLDDPGSCLLAPMTLFCRRLFAVYAAGIDEAKGTVAVLLHRGHCASLDSGSNTFPQRMHL